MLPDELAVLSLPLLPPSKGPKGGILEYLSEQSLVCYKCAWESPPEGLAD